MKMILCDNINTMKMKKVLTVLIAVLGFTGIINAQDSTATVSSTPAVATASTATANEDEAECYCCPKADYCSTQPGKCALHYNIDLVKDGEYFCPMIDNVTGNMQGYCPGTGNEMQQMEANNCAGGLNMDQKAPKDKNKKNKNNQQNEGSTSSEGETQTGK